MDKERDASLDNKRDTGRLEAFSDGVIAVAITLLILDIHVPSLYAHTPLLLVLSNSGIAYLGYVISFTIIGLFWANHHYMFKYICLPTASPLGSSDLLHLERTRSKQQKRKDTRYENDDYNSI